MQLYIFINNIYITLTTVHLFSDQIEVGDPSRFVSYTFSIIDINIITTI